MWNYESDINWAKSQALKTLASALWVASNVLEKLANEVYKKS